MLELRFFNETPPESTQVTGEKFGFDSKTIRTQPSGTIVATHVRDHWLVGGNLFPAPGAHRRRADRRQTPACHPARNARLELAEGDETWLGFSLVPAMRP